jgi:uncharacterized membrane protein YraQ (UPF0718 family)
MHCNGAEIQKTKSNKKMIDRHSLVQALKNSARQMANLLPIFILFLKPSHVARFLGRKSGIRGMVFSAIGGIISMGPIYAWHPLLKDLREKGAANMLIAIFLGNRAVNPFLMPIMISYFGWVYVMILTFFTITGSVAAGYVVRGLVKE